MDTKGEDTCSGAHCLSSEEKNPSGSKGDDGVNLDRPHDNLKLKSNPRPLLKDELVDGLQNENKLLKGRLKGYEALASLYQKSKNNCSQLQKQCEEQKNLIEQHQFNGSHLQFLPTEHSGVVTCNEKDLSATCNCLLANSEMSSTAAEKGCNSFEIVEMLTSDRNEVSSSFEIPALTLKIAESENLQNCGISEFEKPEDDKLEEMLSGSNDQLEIPFLNNEHGDDEECYMSEDGGHRLNLNEQNSESLGCVELRAFQRHFSDTRVSSESKSFLMELLAVGLKFIHLDGQICEKENCDRVSPPSASRVYHQMASCSKPRSPVRLSTKEESTQTENFTPNPFLSAESKLPPQVECWPTCMSPESAGDLLNEIQILQAQVMTFKDDFQQERRDRENAQSKCISLKQQFHRVTAELTDLKLKIKAKELQFEIAKKENAALKLQISKIQAKESQFEIVKKENAALKLQISKAMEKLGHFQPNSVLSCVPQLHRSRRTETSTVSQKWLCVRCGYLNHQWCTMCEMCRLESSYAQTKAK